MVNGHSATCYLLLLTHSLRLMLNSRPVRLLWHSLNWLTRMTLITTAGIAILCAIIVMVLRYWLLPDIEQFHDKITTSLSGAMGNPVTISKIKGDWYGLHPHLSLTDIRIIDSQGQVALALPNIDASVSWLSLLAAELRLASLEIDRPQLLVRRDVTGKIYIGSIAVATEGTNSNFSDWLLHQPRIVVRDAVIVWQDQLRGAPALQLSQVNLRIENLFSHHQFALRAVPPGKLSTALDLRGDFHGRHFNQLSKWDGQLFTRLDYIDLQAWRAWLNLPAELSRGHGGLRSWLSIKGGRLSQITADLQLHDVSSRLGDKLPEMEVHYLRGRVTWKMLADGWDFATQHLSMRLTNGLSLQPTDFYFRATRKANQPGGELRANQLQLETLVSLSDFLPLEAGLRSQLTAYAPRGHVSKLDLNWQGTTPLVYQIKGQFDNLAMQKTDRMPGFSGLSLSVDGSERSGDLNINTRNLTLDAPDILREALSIDTLTGQVHWQRDKGELGIRIVSLAVANADLAGTVAGSFNTKAGTKGSTDLTVNLTRGEIKYAAKYTPLFALNKKDSDWLNGAILSGHTEDFNLLIKGNLDDFPLDGTKKTLFSLNAHAKDATLKYAPDWPEIEHLSGEFSIRNNRMSVQASAATILAANISHLSILQPDMAKFDTPLQINGVADGPNNTFLEFIQQSPVRGYIDGFTDGIKASGNGHLDLAAQIPLLMSRPAKVSGLFRVQGSDVDLGASIPWLRNTQGTLSFTESGMKTNTVTANILGGPTSLNILTLPGGELRVNLKGRSNMEVLRKTESTPLLNYLQGETAWDANISVVKKIAQLTINSNLQGINSSLPAPFNKQANESWPLHIEKKNVAKNQDVITAQLGNLLKAHLISTELNGVTSIGRGTINFGTQRSASGKEDPSAGIWLTGNLPVLSLQGWNGLGTGSGPSIPVSGANLHIDQLTGYGINMNDLQLNLAKRSDGFALQLSGKPLNGEVVWQPHGYNGSSKISARLHNLFLTTTEDKAGFPVKPPAAAHPQTLPAVDFNIENLQYKNKSIGHVEVVGFPEGQDWRLKRLNVANPDGILSGDGLWRSAPMQTEVNLLLDISNAGKILTRSGYPNTVKNGSGQLLARLSWDGQPDNFNYASLDGTLKLDTGRGQFLKMDPGFGKLLGILSLQALPKRITLDFADVFSAGFEFDNINGNAQVRHGVMQTDDLHIEGSSAKVTMKGQINLNNETQNLRVVVLPTLGSSISMLSAFAGGPVVGIGTLIVNKVLGNPLDKLMAYEYNITGDWSNPNVVKLGRKQLRAGLLPAE